MYTEHFSLANIPFGIASSTVHPAKSVVTRLCDDVIFLDRLVEANVLSDLSLELIEALSQVQRP
jgi:fumarylacetoacetase